jgi:Htaa
MLRSFARCARVPALAALTLVALAVPASAATVTAGKLDWSTTKIYISGGPVDRTWLGYVTSPSPLANGTATPSDGATGDTVTTATASGTLATWSFPLVGGTYEPADGTGTIAFDGSVTFVSPPPPPGPTGGHGFTYSIADPRIVLNGDSGQLFASGVGTPRGSRGPTPYDPNLPIFNLDLSNATVTLHANGSRTIAGIVPSIATASLAFPSDYGVGAGPDRRPNTFGAFSLRVKTAPVAGPKGDKGDPGAPGKSVVLQTSVLRRAPFPDGGRRHEIELLTTRGKQLVARGAVRARTIRVRLAEGRTQRLRGVYLLKTGEQPAKRVRVL